MPQTSVVFGLALCGLTVLGMVGSPEKLATAFVPMMLGIPLVFCGIVSLNPHRKRSWMWVAGTVALIGLLASSVRLVHQAYQVLDHHLVNWFALGLMWGVCGLCSAYLLLLGLDMFRQHRRRGGRRRGRSKPHTPPAETPVPPEDTAHETIRSPALLASEKKTPHSMSSSLGA
ncbi:hypothetical protein [Roseimaritima sediminicola]|uniref:hypothetical protein n=1 Tax=Roseimaritima sediminicola TaxID=2662066 RepID=UPI0012983D57|nr:hypothetical protein [Roseimaritima sediminicola]